MCTVDRSAPPRVDHDGDNLLSRRRFLRTGAVAAAASAAVGLLAPRTGSAAPPVRVNDHGGPVYPRIEVPNLAMGCSDETSTGLQELLRGHVTAVQLVWVGCSTTCPIQGAIFEMTQQLLGARVGSDIRLLSISINPLEDSVADLHSWLARFHAGAGWLAARPAVEDLDVLQSAFGNTRDPLTSHSTQVQIVDRTARLVWRTNELPSPESIADVLLAAAGPR